MNCYVIFITFHHCCFRSEEWWRPDTSTWNESLGFVGSPHREASLFTSTLAIRQSPFSCESVLIWRPWQLFGIPPACLTYFSSLLIRERGLTGSWKIRHCCLQENEHFTGWVATQQQMVDLNKNSIHSLFCHFLVFLLILSMFNHFN